MQFLSANKHTGIKWEKLHTSHLGILKAEFGLRQGLITQRGGSLPPPPEKHQGRTLCRLWSMLGNSREAFVEQRSDEVYNRFPGEGHRRIGGCGEAEKFGKSLLQMREKKKNNSFGFLFHSAQTPTCLTQLQWLKGRISLLFLTLHPSSLALSSAEAINQACAPSLSLSL